MEKNELFWQIWNLFKEIEQKRTLAYHHIGKAIDLTPLQVRILAQLKIDGQITIGALAHNLLMDTGNLSRSVKQLVELNLVQREYKLGDNRSVYTSLTEKGLQIINQKFKETENLFANFNKDVPPDYLHIILEMLDKFNNYLRNIDFSTLESKLNL